MNSLTAQILIKLLNKEMGLPANRAWVRDQDRLIPSDKQLFVVVGLTGATPVANVTRMEDVVVGMDTIEHQICEVQMLENIQIDIASRNNDAITRHWEVVAALQSFYGQQLQELNNFKIFRIPRNFLNTSNAEGAAMLNRYTIVVSCLVWYRKDTVLTSPLGDYYDDFNTRVDDENTIGTGTPLIEFEITPDTPPPFNNEA